MSRSDLELIHAVLKAFPTRPMRVARGYGRILAYYVVAISVCIATAGIFAYFSGIPIVREWSLVGRAVAAPTIRVEADCKVQTFVFWSCTMSYYRADARRTKMGSKKLFFVSTRSSTFTVRPLQSPDQPAVITSDFALEHLWNRALTLAVCILVFLFVAGYAAVAATRWIHSSLDLKRLSGRRLTPVVVRLKPTPEKQRRWEALWQRYMLYEHDGREYSMVTRLTQMPLRLSENAVLAVRAESHSKPILLDGDLRMLDFTQAERAAVIKALTRETAQ